MFVVKCVVNIQIHGFGLIGGMTGSSCLCIIASAKTATKKIHTLLICLLMQPLYSQWVHSYYFTKASALLAGRCSLARSCIDRSIDRVSLANSRSIDKNREVTSKQVIVVINSNSFETYK